MFNKTKQNSSAQKLGELAASQETAEQGRIDNLIDEPEAAVRSVRSGNDAHCLQLFRGKKQAATASSIANGLDDKPIKSKLKSQHLSGIDVAPSPIPRTGHPMDSLSPEFTYTSSGG